MSGIDDALLFLRDNANHILQPQREGDPVKTYTTVPFAVAEKAIRIALGEEDTNEDGVGFEEWWGVYDKKTAKTKATKLWNKLSNNKKCFALEHTREYVVSTPNKQYRMGPDKYLRNECWNDEIIEYNNGKQAGNFSSEQLINAFKTG